MPLDPSAARVVAHAVVDVAERSFFAAAEVADLVTADPPPPPHDWLVASVRFDEADAAGTVSCLLPEALARSLFDAFNGRDPLAPFPAIDQLFDLVGEFSNMVCGAWLTRVAGDQSFVLGKPLVRPVLDALALSTADGTRTTMLINDLPLLVDVRMEPPKTAARRRATA
jgi:hypothetical protein